jgi:hypothetical protein
MCDIESAFKTMVENTPGMSFPKLGMMIGENHKKLQALFDPDREDRPFQMKHMIPAMTACDDLTPLKLMNAHFGLSVFKLTAQKKNANLDSNVVIELLSEATKAAHEITNAISPDSPGGKDLTRGEQQSCLKSALKTINVLMGIVNILQDQSE